MQITTLNYNGVFRKYQSKGQGKGQNNSYAAFHMATGVDKAVVFFRGFTPDLRIYFAAEAAEAENLREAIHLYRTRGADAFKAFARALSPQKSSSQSSSQSSSWTALHFIHAGDRYVSTLALAYNEENKSLYFSLSKKEGNDKKSIKIKLSPGELCLLERKLERIVNHLLDVENLLNQQRLAQLREAGADNSSVDNNSNDNGAGFIPPAEPIEDDIPF